jgi:hypothetical protein
VPSKSKKLEGFEELLTGGVVVALPEKISLTWEICAKEMPENSKMVKYNLFIIVIFNN